MHVKHAIGTEQNVTL